MATQVGQVLLKGATSLWGEQGCFVSHSGHNDLMALNRIILSTQFSNLKYNYFIMPPSGPD